MANSIQNWFLFAKSTLFFKFRLRKSFLKLVPSTYKINNKINRKFPTVPRLTEENDDTVK